MKIQWKKSIKILKKNIFKGIRRKSNRKKSIKILKKIFLKELDENPIEKII